ncbi:MAG: succinylglutamate desuccinylase/aspartoacylase family protein [Methanobacterium sp. ERen5]|nr:MAG: succinylglutamate desuccinylase/aspartoacylase family protein [Methanobacterium sp. ERen5]
MLMDHIPDGDISYKMIKAARYGTPMMKMGNGSPKVMITAGVHGNEIPPQIAALELLEYLDAENLNGTVYVVPFAVPNATKNDSRRFKGFDMNRSAKKRGSATNKILMAVETLGVLSLADFHSTKPGSNPGIESVFCSKKPCSGSVKIAKHITNATSSKVICHKLAGALYGGALEDECNLKYIAAVTCEVVSENNLVRPGSVEASFRQMISYLEYFDVV